MMIHHGDTEARRASLNEVVQRVIGLCIEVHRELGPGLLESAYEEALAYELSGANISFVRQCEVPLRYKDRALNCGYRLDFVVERELVIELKSVQELLPVHHAARPGGMVVGLPGVIEGCRRRSDHGFLDGCRDDRAGPSARSPTAAAVAARGAIAGVA